MGLIGPHIVASHGPRHLSPIQYLMEAHQVGRHGIFGDGYIPHNVVLDHNYQVIYTASGYNESTILILLI